MAPGTQQLEYQSVVFLFKPYLGFLFQPTYRGHQQVASFPSVLGLSKHSAFHSNETPRELVGQLADGGTDNGNLLGGSFPGLGYIVKITPIYKS